MILIMVWVKGNHHHHLDWDLPYHIERKVSAIEIVFPEKMRFPNKEPLFQISWIIPFKYRHTSRLDPYPWYLGSGTWVFGLIFLNTLIVFKRGTWLYWAHLNSPRCLQDNHETSFKIHWKHFTNMNYTVPQPAFQRCKNQQMIFLIPSCIRTTMSTM